MNASRRAAISAGILYIIGTVTGVLSVVFIGTAIEPGGYLTYIAANEQQVILGSLCILTMGVALALIPVVLYPVLKKLNQTLAIGYIVFRSALETFTYIVSVLVILLLVTLSREAIIGGAELAGSEVVGALLVHVDMWISAILGVVFIIGALMFYTILFQFRLVPRWLSGWGLIAAVPYLAAGFLVMFGFVEHMSDLFTMLQMPLALQEMILALWLIIRGFNRGTEAES